MCKKLICSLFLLLSFHSYASSELDRAVEAQGQLLTDNQQKITDLQGEVDQLRGQLEETTYQLNQVIERQKMILQQLDGKSQNNTTATSNTAPSTLANWSATGNDKADYNFIIQYVLDGKQSKDAITAFQQYLKDYPKSSYRANVNYWLGQLCYGQGKQDDASFYYATVVKDFPKSAKAADSLYKIGVIFLDKGDKVKAKAIFQQVLSQYPNDKNATSLANSKLTTIG
ncbi:tol-pal system protein YbgF [Orbus hercynius]|uniref:Cell division coordinator CpoB n=1 Tax=Orbus hercynius TaxID=593135 RepID=A0A495RLZ7_9GAMM|nr:tol-pal system protein YbgF [Orbus hercynius]RKS87828.1 tol-pal system protein YbgF [Orbus hercynius]